MKTLLAFLVPLCLSATPEWSVWRGPQGNGNYDHETTWKHEWPESGPEILWRVPVHLGYSGIVVSEGRAYTVGNLDGEDLIQCLDVETGKSIWTVRYPQELVPKYNPGGPNASPVIEGKWLYLLSKQGLLSCLDKVSGETRWRTDVAALARAPMPTWGFASCPVIIGDRLFLNANTSGIALDKNTGKLLWNSAPGSGGYAVPVPLICKKQAALAIFGYAAMHIVSQNAGELLRKIDWATRMGENSADPVIIGDDVYLSSWWDMGAALFDPNEDTVDAIWTNKEFQNHISAPVLHDGYLYGFDGPVHRKEKGALRCVDAASGKTRWSHEALKGSLILSQGKLIILSNNGRLVVAKASPDGYEELASRQGFGKRTWAPPVLHRGKLYLRDADGWAICLDLGD